MRTVYTWWKR